MPDFFNPNVEAFYANGLFALDAAVNHFDGINFRHTEFYTMSNGEVKTTMEEVEAQKRLLNTPPEESIGNYESYIIF
jgi:hypothetical protein